MPLPAAIATLPALGKTLAGVGSAALPYLPALGAAGGAWSQRDRDLEECFKAVLSEGHLLGDLEDQ